MDSHSQNVCLIGVLHIFYCLLFSLEPLVKAIRLVNTETIIYTNLLLYLGLIGFYSLLSILVFLMLRGVLKQRYLLMVPFLIFSFLILAFRLILFLSEQLQGLYYFIGDSFYKIAVQLLVLYPVYTLFLKLRVQYQKEKALSENTFEKEMKIIEIFRQIHSE
ncbi:uncharacterized protein LOC124420658 [Lucilia cuprina]|uniref:uncharacterized protein LOC124420658 n=1 Tax=Lucilia cuprina TaxID=7375 RepID=UPI001F06D6A0|nr:uncharacterized protein LOC124420658 [Lucilia cuprina]